jgi:hypothetical protein
MLWFNSIKQNTMCIPKLKHCKTIEIDTNSTNQFPTPKCTECNSGYVPIFRET